MNNFAGHQQCGNLMRILKIVSAALLLSGVVHAADIHPSLPPIGSLDGLGVNIHFTDPKPGEMEMIAAAGFKWVRTDLSWSDTEREKNKYDFSAYDRLIAALAKQKMRALFILDYGNPLYAEPDEKHPFTSRAGTEVFRAAFAKWAAAAVKHFAGKGCLWEMWNEPNIKSFWAPAPNVDDYIALAKATATALHEAAPKEAFIGPSTSTIDLKFIEKCFKAGLLDHWCAVSVHPYRQSAPETVEDDLRALRLLIRKYAPKNKAIPIISGEWGYSTAWKNFDEEKQAKYLAREFLTNITNDIPLSIWYDWRDDGTDLTDPEHHFGIVHNEYHEGRDPVFDPKPAYQAAKTMTKQLAGTGFNKHLTNYPESETERLLLFDKGNVVRVVMWNYGSLNLGFQTPSLGSQPGKFDCVCFNGENLNEVANMDTTCGYAPLYYTPSDTVTFNAFRIAAAWEREPERFEVRVPSEFSVTTRLINPLRSALPVDFSVYHSVPGVGECGTGRSLPKPGYTIAPGKSAKKTFPIQVDSHTYGQDIIFILLLWSKKGGEPNFFWQRSRIELTNAISIELLPPSDSAFVLRITNPTGEAVNGTATLYIELFNAMTGMAPPNIKLIGLESSPTLALSQPFSVKAGACETIVKFPFPEFKQPDGALKRVLPDQCKWLHGFGETENPQSSFSMRPSLGPHWLPDLKANALKTATDGDPSVRAETSIANGTPVDGNSPSEMANVRISYSMDAGWKFCRVAFAASSDQTIPFFDPELPASHPEWTESVAAKKFCLWIHGDGKGCQSRIRFLDSTGQTFQSDGPKIDWTGWRYILFPMYSTDEKPLNYWGGANDGVIHYPIKWDSIFLLDNVSRQPVEGEIYLSAPTLIY